MLTYKNDSLIEIVKLYKLSQYNPELNIQTFKSNLYDKSIKYEMKDYELLVDIVDCARTYNHNIERTPIGGFGYFDIFKFGGEIFFILDTGYPLPIQLVETKELNNQINIATELFKQEGQIAIIKRDNISELILGNWKTQSANTDKKDSIDYITINRDSFIINWNS